MLLDATVDLLRVLGAQVANRAVDKLEPGPYRPAANRRHLVGMADALDLGVRVKAEVHPINAIDRRLGQPVADEFGKVAAHLARERELAIGEGACSREARRDAAGVAVRALTGASLGAAPALYGEAALHHRDASTASLAEKTERAEDACRARSHDDDISGDGPSIAGLHVLSSRECSAP